MKWLDYWTVGRVLMFLVTLFGIELFPMLFTWDLFLDYAFYYRQYLDADPSAFCYFKNPYQSNAQIQCADYYLLQANIYMMIVWGMVALMVFVGMSILTTFPYASKEWRVKQNEN